MTPLRALLWLAGFVGAIVSVVLSVWFFATGATQLGLIFQCCMFGCFGVFTIIGMTATK